MFPTETLPPPFVAGRKPPARWGGLQDPQVPAARPCGCGAGHPLRNVGLDKMIFSTPNEKKQLVIAMIAARILDPCSKLATARGLADETA
jgi:hypothetical protein